jgi:hypothetical protein
LKNKSLSSEATNNKTELGSFYNYLNELQGTISFQQKLIAELQKEKVALIKLIEAKL